MCATGSANGLFILAHVVFSVTSATYNIPPLSQRFKRQSSCNKLEFTCTNKECIPSYNVCDGEKDCTDGSDETSSTCRALNIRCPPLAFQCSYGACIDKTLKCDGKSDCADGSDEQCQGSTPSSNCGSGQFPCSSGQCVDQYSVCDGVKDCSDGSDETREQCKNIRCPSSSFQCHYGACVERSMKCNGQQDCPDGSDELGCNVTTPTNRPITSPSFPGGCRLPEHPKHGIYVSNQCQAGDLAAGCRNIPGTPVQRNWLLKYSCNNNYDLTSSDSDFSVCDNGIWKNPLDCIKLCPPLRSLSVDVRCVFNGREVPCERSMKPNTTATAKCKQHYKETYKPEYSSLQCLNNGEWSFPLFYCTPDCGIATKIEATNLDKVVPLISGGVPAKLGEFPWLTAIFLKNENEWVQRCGGTLISSHVVVTAAHCLVLIEGTVTPENIKVGLGKYNRDFYKKESYSIIADVREIVTPRYYSGGNSFYALDIGLLDLKFSVQVTAYIMPACVDWTSILITLSPGLIGHVAGWGTTENKTSSETVLSSKLSYIDNTACITKVRQAYKRYITHDKFCAGNVDGSQVDKGDSGGGMTIVNNGQHFLIGVVSTKITEETSFSLFTDITNAEHHTWLEDQRNRLNDFHRET